MVPPRINWRSIAITVIIQTDPGEMKRKGSQFECNGLLATVDRDRATIQTPCGFGDARGWILLVWHNR
jgi:hypothetical protein